ncbi:TonB family protein [Hymenobacter terrigena]
MYTYVEQMPQPPGGGGNAVIVALIQKGVHLPLFHGQYPERSRVMVEFTVTQTGTVQNICIRQSINHQVDAAVVKAVQDLPNFTPARQYGQPVRVKYTMPITFHWQ